MRKLKKDVRNRFYFRTVSPEVMLKELRQPLNQKTLHSMNLIKTQPTKFIDESHKIARIVPFVLADEYNIWLTQKTLLVRVGVKESVQNIISRFARDLGVHMFNNFRVLRACPHERGFDGAELTIIVGVTPPPDLDIKGLMDETPLPGIYHEEDLELIENNSMYNSLMQDAFAATAKEGM